GGLSVPGPDEGSRRAGSSPLCRFDADGGGGCVLRRLYDLLDGRAHQSLQDARRARRRVQSREHGGNHGRAVVRRLGVRRHAGCLCIVLLLVLPRHGSLASEFVDTFTVAFCFTFLGHYVDRLLLALPEIRTGVGPMVRVIGWFAGGLWCAVVARWLWIRFGRELGELPGLIWGGVLLVVLELVARRRGAESPQ